MLKSNYYWILILIPLGFLGWYFYNTSENKPLRTLPFFGKKNALSKNDTIYHTIPPFYFINQYNEKVTEKTVEGKIYVADYFFTTCQSICPIMSNEMKRVYDVFKNKSDVLFLSHTVNPEMDSVSILLDYAKQHGVVDKRWLFLTGDKKHLYEVAREGYLLNAEKGDGGPDDFIHTQNFALIDKDRHIRGYYDGTDSLEINRLIIEINVLLNEYAYKEKK